MCRLRWRGLVAQSHVRQWLAFVNRCRHGATDQLEEALSILRIGNALRRELLRRARTEKGRFQFRVRTDGFAYVGLLIADVARKPRPLCEELHLLDNPTCTVSVVLLLTDDASFCITPAFRNRDSLACNTASSHQVSGLRLRLRLLQRPFQVLAPDRPLAPACQKPYVVGRILVGPELIVCGAVVLQSANE